MTQPRENTREKGKILLLKKWNGKMRGKQKF
jgi:hypothetical protein